MRLPNGYGSVVKMSGNRRRPYAIRKTKGFNEKGHPIQITLGYTATREEGLALLAAFNQDPWDMDRAKITLEELYRLWLEKKAPKLGRANRACLIAVFRHCWKYTGKKYREIKAYHMQDTIDACGRSYSTQGAIKNLWNHLDKFALELDICRNGYSRLLTREPIPPTTRERFTDEEIERLWERAGEPWIDTVLILMYSGWRISEFLNMKISDVDLAAGTMKGGVKTAAGKNRIVPIHNLIFDFVRRRVATAEREYLITCEGRPLTQNKYRAIWNSVLAPLGIEKTPHECRHTFESLLDSAGANRKCIDLMMGHVSKDTGNRIYNHKTTQRGG